MVLGFLGRSAYGQVSALINYPVADGLAHREFQFNHNFTSADTGLNASYLHSTNILLGLFDRLEISGSTDWLGESNFGFKFTAFRSKDEKTVVATGLQNMKGVGGDPFCCVRQNTGNYNLHAGWLNSGESQVTFGADTMLNSRLGCSCEYGGGTTGSSSLCLYYTLSTGLQLQTMYTKPNDTTVDPFHTFVLTYTIRI
jgi:hypothetical protein